MCQSIQFGLFVMKVVCSTLTQGRLGTQGRQGRHGIIEKPSTGMGVTYKHANKHYAPLEHIRNIRSTSTTQRQEQYTNKTCVCVSWGQKNITHAINASMRRAPLESGETVHDINTEQKYHQFTSITSSFAARRGKHGPFRRSEVTLRFGG